MLKVNIVRENPYPPVTFGASPRPGPPQRQRLLWGGTQGGLTLSTVSQRVTVAGDGLLHVPKSRFNIEATQIQAARQGCRALRVSQGIADSHTPRPTHDRRQSLPQTREVAHSAGGSDKKALLSLPQSPVGDSPLIGGGLTATPSIAKYRIVSVIHTHTLFSPAATRPQTKPPSDEGGGAERRRE